MVHTRLDAMDKQEKRFYSISNVAIFRLFIIFIRYLLNYFAIFAWISPEAGKSGKICIAFSIKPPESLLFIEIYRIQYNKFCIMYRKQNNFTVTPEVNVVRFSAVIVSVVLF